MIPVAVHFTSQYSFTEPDWRTRACAIASLKMVIDYWASSWKECRSATLSELLEAGLREGAYREGVGWDHRGIAAVARSLGYSAMNRDLAPRSPHPATPEESWRVLKEDLMNGPVLVSVWSKFDPMVKGGHVAVAWKIEDDQIGISDPEETSPENAWKVFSKEEFLKSFKQRTIVILPYGTST